MRKLLLLAFSTITAFRIFGLDVLPSHGNIVGFHNVSISQGVSRIKINADSLDVFPTLGDIVAFNPSEAIVGDEITFLLDGTRQTYQFVSYDGTNAVLTTCRNSLPKPITLNGIPLLDSYEFNHKNEQTVSIISAGGISSRYAREVGLKSPPPPNGITVEYVSSNDNKSHPLKERPNNLFR